MKDLRLDFVTVEDKPKSTSVKEFTIKTPLVAKFIGTTPGAYADDWYVLEDYETRKQVIPQSVAGLKFKMKEVPVGNIVIIYWDGYEKLKDGKEMIKVVVKHAPPPSDQ